MDFDIIDPVDLSVDQRRQMALIMQSGNLVLKECYLQALKNKSSRYARSHFRKALFVAMKNWDKKSALIVEGVQIQPAQLKLIQAVRNIEYPVLQSMSKLIFKQAVKCRKCFVNGVGRKTKISVEELYQEGVLAVVNSVYCYTNTEVKFSTYATNSVKRQFLNYFRSLKDMSHWTNKDSKLFGRFERERKVAEQEIDQTGKSHGAVTFDELIERMGLNDEERTVLQAMLIGVATQSDIESRQNDQEGIDITGLSKDTDPNHHDILDVDQRTAYEQVKVEMNDLERAVMDAFLNASLDSHGWKAEVVRNMVNPLTGKKYTRATPSVVLKRIQKKVLDAYAAMAA